MKIRPSEDLWNYLDSAVVCDKEIEIEVNKIKITLFVFLAVLLLVIISLLLWELIV